MIMIMIIIQIYHLSACSCSERAPWLSHPALSTAQSMIIMFEIVVITEGSSSSLLHNMRSILPKHHHHQLCATRRYIKTELLPWVWARWCWWRWRYCRTKKLKFCECFSTAAHFFQHTLHEHRGWLRSKSSSSLLFSTRDTVALGLQAALEAMVIIMSCKQNRRSS